MNLVVGNRVKFINENLEGEIIAIVSDKKVLVACSDGFDHEVNTSEIIVVSEDGMNHFNVDEQQVKDKIKNMPAAKKLPHSFMSRYTSNTKYQFERVAEIDLHLEELVEFPNRLDDWQKLHTQIQHVKKCIIAAQEERVNRLVFIHGVGTGVLKSELRNFLANYDNISFKDADYREYGVGATEVLIK